MRRRGLAAIDRRLGTLDELLTKMGLARQLKEENRRALQEQIDSQKADLRELRAKIESDAGAETLRADLRSIVESFRVYLLMAPKMHVVLTADRVLATAALLETLAGKLQGILDKGSASADVQAALDSMRTHIAAARDAVQGIPDKVIPLRPADFPGNRSILQEARESLQTARHELRLARDDARKAVEALRSR